MQVDLTSLGAELVEPEGPPIPEAPPTPRAAAPRLPAPTPIEITTLRDKVAALAPKVRPYSEVAAELGGEGGPVFMPPNDAMLEQPSPANIRASRLSSLANDYLNLAETAHNFAGGARQTITQEGGGTAALPFVGRIFGASARGLRNELLEKFSSGKPLEPMEQHALDAMALAERRVKQAPSFWEQVGRLSADSAKYAAEFGLSSGIYGGVRAATAKALGPIASRLAAVGAQAAIGGAGATAETYLDRTAKQWGVDPKTLAATIDDKQADKDIGTELLKSGADTYIEYLSERAGAPIARGVSKALGVVPKEAFVKLFRLGAIQDWMRRAGQTSFAQAANEVKKAVGFHGVTGEVAEEYIGNALKALVGVDDQNNVAAALADGDVGEAVSRFFNSLPVKETPAMATAFGLIPAGQHATELGIAGAQAIGKSIKEAPLRRSVRETMAELATPQQRRDARAKSSVNQVIEEGQNNAHSIEGSIPQISGNPPGPVPPVSEGSPGALSGSAGTTPPEAEGRPPVVPAAATPPLPPNHQTVTIQRADGSTYEAAFGGYWTDVPGTPPVISRVKDGAWSTGTLDEGEKIASQVPARPGRETTTPAEDVSIGMNEAGESLFQRKDGSVYRMRKDRPSTHPNGYPDFGGDLAPAPDQPPKTSLVIPPEYKPKYSNIDGGVVSIMVQTPQGIRRATVSAKANDDGSGNLSFIKLHDDDTGSYEQIPVPAPNKPFASMDEAHEYGFKLLMERFKAPTAPAQLPPPGATPATLKDIVISTDMDAAAKARALKKMADDQGKTLKEIQEEAEGELVRHAYDVVYGANYLHGKANFDALRAIYEHQPNFSARTSTTVANQAYSTPLPLSYALSWATRVDPTTPILDTTAGNGMMFIGGSRVKAGANEIDPRRLAELRKLLVFGKVTNQDATKFTSDQKWPVVKLNPPFGSTPDVNYHGYRIKRLEHIIALKALEHMTDDGAATLVMGAKREEGEQGKGAQWVFENYLYRYFHVLGNFEVAGDLYAKQGTKWPVRVIVLAGRRAEPQAMKEYAPKTVKRFTTWEEVWNEAERIRNEVERQRQTLVPGEPGKLPVRPPAGTTPPAGPGNVPGPAGGTPGAAGGAGGRRPTGPRGGKNPAGPADGGTDLTPIGNVPGPGNPGAPPAAHGELGNSPPRVDGGRTQRPGETGNVGGGGETTGGGAKPGIVPGPAPSGGLKTGDLVNVGEADLDALIDDVIGSQPATAPAPAPQPTPAPTVEAPEAQVMPAPAPTTPQEGPKTSDVVKDIIKDLGKHGIKGLDETIQGLGDIFGGGGNLGTLGPGFDENSYQKAKPHFRKAYDSFVKAGKSLKEFITVMVQQLQKLGVDAKAYIKRFVADLKEELKKVEGTEYQVEYQVKSKGAPFGTLTPKSLAEGEHTAMTLLEAAVGPVDEYVAGMLNMPVQEVRDTMAAEQIDGVAQAIYQIENDGALVLADQAGVGKGRQAAAIIRYAIVNGKVPIFFTKDAKLYTDIYGELKEIHTDVKPFLLGSPEKANIVAPDGSVIVSAPKLEKQKSDIKRILENGLANAGFNAVFATYSQVNDRNHRQHFLERLAAMGPTIVILDESHEAAGDGESSMQAAFMMGGQVKRTQGNAVVQIPVPGLLRQKGTLHANEGGVLYMSATFAKRSDNMPVYFRTALSKATQSFRTLVNAMERGGVAMQQAVSEALAKSGQYLRRERDLGGAPYDMRPIGMENKEGLIAHVDEITDVLHAIMDFSDQIRNRVSGSTAQSGDALVMAPFSSLVHNQIGQLLLGAKVDAVVEHAIKAAQDGEKPVIVLYNTMQSFLDMYAEERGLRNGTPMRARWNELLKYALDRTLRATQTNPDGSKTIHVINPADHGLEAFYKQVADMCAEVESRFPISPIDYIIQKLEGAGVKMSELTGRTSGITYTNFETGEGIYRKFPTANKNQVVGGFNNGVSDGMLLNAAGSTGLSAHAGARMMGVTSTDKRPRHMFIVQPAPDINVFVQTLFRIFRTGLEKTGVMDRGGVKLQYGARYSHLVLPLQAELRPAAMSQMKLKSLNANTTADTDNAIKIESANIFNKYGDMVVIEYLDRHPTMQSAVHIWPDVNQDGTLKPKTDAARQFTGRIAMLPDAQQKEAYEDIIPAYNELIEQLKATGEYDLEMAIHDDWDGNLTDDQQLSAATGPEDNIFTASVRLQRWEVSDKRHVPTGPEMQEAYQKRWPKPRQLMDEWNEFRQRAIAYIAQRERAVAQAEQEADKEQDPNKKGPLTSHASAMRSQQADLLRRWDSSESTISSALDKANNAQVVKLDNLKTHEGSEGMLVDVRWPKSMRLSPPTFRFKFMLHEPGGVAYLTAADLRHAEGWEINTSNKEASDLGPGDATYRYNRYFVTGNPIRAYDATGGAGKLVRFLDHQSETITGLMMPRNWTPANLAQDPRLDLVSPEAVVHFLRNHVMLPNRRFFAIGSANLVNLESADGSVHRWTIKVPKARRTGGKIYGDSEIRRLTGEWNEDRSRNRMVVNIDLDKLRPILRRIMEITDEKFRPSGNINLLVPLVAQSNAQGNRRGSLETDSVPGVKRFAGKDLRGSLSDLREAVNGPEANLPPAAVKVINAMLDAPVLNKLDDLRYRIADTLQDGYQGSYFGKLIEMARNADPATFPHEVGHAIWEVLPSDLQAEFGRLRVEALRELEGRGEDIDSLIDQPCKSTREFLERGLARNLYRYSNDEEFFTHTFSEQFTRQSGSIVPGFWDRVKALWQQFVAAIKRGLGLRPNQEQVINDIIAGRFENTPESGLEYERQGSIGPTGPADEIGADEERLAAQYEAEQAGGIPTKMFGKPYYTTDRETITTESSEAGAALAKQIFDSSNVPVERQAMPDPSTGLTRRGWMSPLQGRNMTAEWRLVLEQMKQQLAGQHEEAKPRDLLGNLINSVRLNYIAGHKSSMAEADPGVRLELISIAQGEASARGAALAALGGFANDIREIGANLDTALGRIWSNEFGGDDLRRLMDELRTALAEAQGRNADLEEELKAALEKALEKRPKKVARMFGPETVLGKKLLDMVRKGPGEPWDLLRAIAEERGWKVPSDTEIQRVKDLVKEWDRLEALSPAELARAIEADDVDGTLRQKLALNEPRRAKIRNQVERAWARFARPLGVRTPLQRVNTINAAADFVSANLLFKVGFITRQSVDVVSQWLYQAPTSAVASALTTHLSEVEKGKRSLTDTRIWGEIGNLISNAYNQQAKSLPATLNAAAAAARGSAQAVPIGRLMGRVSVFDRAMDKAKDLEAKGRTVEASLLKLFTYMKFGYTVSQVFDRMQNVPAVEQWMWQQAHDALRQQGLSPAEAQQKADWVMGDRKAELALALSEARAALEADGVTDEKEVKDAAFSLLRHKQYERMLGLHLPADDLRARNQHKAETIAWNLPEHGGVGGFVAENLRRLGRTATTAAGEHPSLLPFVAPVIALTRFSNAIGTQINRKLTWAGAGFFPGAFGVSDRSLDSEGVAHGGSPWYKYPEQRLERKMEAAWGVSFISLAAMLAATGIIVVRLRWPKDKEERQLWDKMGWRPGQVSIQTGPDTHITLGMNTGPLVPFAPGLAAGGALRDLMTDREKQQAKLNAQAEKTGMPAGKIRPMDISDMLGVAMSAIWNSVISGRTISGLTGSLSEQGQFSPIKGVASTISAWTPTLPGLQELGRLFTGRVIDQKMAGLWDYLTPLPPNYQVNLLGDDVGSANGAQRVVSILTGGNYPVPVSDAARQKAETAYSNLFTTGYRPPSIDPNHGYAIGGQFRPMNDDELERYTRLRGEYFKEELDQVGPTDDKKEVSQAFSRANARALEATGVDTPSANRGTGRGASATPVGVGAAGGTRVGIRTSPRASGGISGGRTVGIRAGSSVSGRARLPASRGRRCRSHSGGYPDIP